jgi:hypothetical protein
VIIDNWKKQLQDNPDQKEWVVVLKEADVFELIKEALGISDDNCICRRDIESWNIYINNHEGI